MEVNNLRKAWRYVIPLFFIVLMSGCFSAAPAAGMKIIPPQSNTIPFEGTWKITKCMDSGFSTALKNSGETWVGKKAEFIKEGIKVGDDVWVKPGFKIKTVNSGEYFLHKYGVSLGELAAKNNKAEVITITSGDKFLYEFVRLGENEAIFTIQNNIFLLEKISNEVRSDFREELLNKKGQGNNRLSGGKDLVPYSGLLLGVRYKNGEDTYGYKTWWIAVENMVLHPVMETDNIFLPRKNGFWKIEPERVIQNNRTEDIITVSTPYQLLKNERRPLKLDPESWGKREGDIRKSILYIGNDYISMEISGEGGYTDNSGKWSENRLIIEPIDSIAGEKGVKMSDLAGKNALAIMREARADLIDAMNNSEMIETDRDFKDENFYLQRRTGHWFFKGRLNYKIGGTEAFSDFNIDIVPPSSLVSFDILCVPWTAVKDRVPDASDAYTSPNKDVAVVLSESRLYVYALADGKLGDIPLARIKLDKGESVIMAEWATGVYVDNWEESFMKNDVRRIPEN